MTQADKVNEQKNQPPANKVTGFFLLFPDVLSILLDQCFIPIRALFPNSLQVFQVKFITVDVDKTVAF